MAAMTTVLQAYASNGNSWKYIIPASHTASKPRLVLQKRKEPVGNQVMKEYVTSIVYGTTDSVSGLIIPQRVAFDISVRSPVNGAAADFNAAFATFIDVVGSTEFAAAIPTLGTLPAS